MFEHGAGTAQDVAALCRAGHHAPALYVAAGRAEDTPAVGAGALDPMVLLPACVAAIGASFAQDESAAGRARWLCRLCSFHLSILRPASLFVTPIMGDRGQRFGGMGSTERRTCVTGRQHVCLPSEGAVA